MVILSFRMSFCFCEIDSTFTNSVIFWTGSMNLTLAVAFRGRYILILCATLWTINCGKLLLYLLETAGAYGNLSITAISALINTTALSELS